MHDVKPVSVGLMRGAILALGVFSFAVVLAAHHFADGDLWAKLSLGAHVWLRGCLPQHDLFAFTPTLPEYIDHEWGAGAIFFGVLKFFGPEGLMALKILLAFGALAAALAAGRRLGANWNALLVLAIPAAACLVPGYGPVIRSHAFTFCLFAVTLFLLENIRAGKSGAAFALPVVMLLWANLHGGCVVGLGTISVYTAFALLQRKHFKPTLSALVASFAVTLLNPHGAEFWTVLLPAILHPRARIAEWQPLPLFANDPFLAFRLLFLLALVVVAVAWRRTEKKSWPGLVMLVLTAVLGWRGRRHAPFFAVTTLAFVAPFLEGALAAFVEKMRVKLQPAVALAALYGAVAVYVSAQILPRASFQVLAPVGHDPVREMDILSLAQAGGNLATPFGWGSYCAWRLHPRVKISMDGRYEAAFPESTFELNTDFYEKRGPNWDRLLRDFNVDFILLEFTQERLRPEDLSGRGYDLIWLTEGHSALLAQSKYAERLRQVANDIRQADANLRAAAAKNPPIEAELREAITAVSRLTVNPLDAAIPKKWWTN
jgi:hypothetical protein